MTQLNNYPPYVLIAFGMWLEAEGWTMYDCSERMIYPPTKEVQLTVDLFNEFRIGKEWI